VATIEISDKALAQLDELAERSRKSQGEVLDTAARALHRAWVGSPPEPGEDPIPFKKEFSDNNAHVVLRQKDANNFLRAEGFRYGNITVPAGGDSTDLASIPDFLTWLIPRYGRHSLPALIHDHLIGKDTVGKEREDADTLFRDSMGETKVPFIRRWVMWSAVSIFTQIERPWRGPGAYFRVLAYLWLLLFAATGFVIHFGLAGWWRVPWFAADPVRFVAIAFIGPALLSFAWGWIRYRVGLIGAYALLILPGAIIGLVPALVIYHLLEQVSKPVLMVLQRANPNVKVNPVLVKNAS
jgi:hypothetical protein